MTQSGSISVYMQGDQHNTPTFSNVVQVSAVDQVIQIDFGYFTADALSAIQHHEEGHHGFSLFAAHGARIVMLEKDVQQLITLLQGVLTGSENA